jgi:hypothetical protein
LVSTVETTRLSFINLQSCYLAQSKNADTKTQQNILVVNNLDAVLGLDQSLSSKSFKALASSETASSSALTPTPTPSNHSEKVLEENHYEATKVATPPML